MTILNAIHRVRKHFPFAGYIKPGDDNKFGSYYNIASVVLRYLPSGSSILDFGCGPCNRTAVLQFLGFQCSACDDLQDAWCDLPGNREKIIAFANQCGIDFCLLQGNLLPFREHSFDMVMLTDVIEHLHDSPRSLLNDLLELVKPEGLLFVTVPNAVNIRKRLNVLVGRTNLPPFKQYFYYPSPWRGHIREYVKNDLVLLAEYLDLEVLELRGCDHMLFRLPKFIRPAYRLVTYFFPGLKDTWVLVARKKKGWTPN